MIHYARRPEMETREEKLSFIAGNALGSIPFNAVQPDRKYNWINLTTNDWGGLLPIADARTKVSKFPSQDRAIFRLFSRGVATQRDEWVYDFDREHLIEKAKYLVATYEQEGKTQRHLTATLSSGIASWSVIEKRELGSSLRSARLNARSIVRIALDGFILIRTSME
jgi:predicted helicase